MIFRFDLFSRAADTGNVQAIYALGMCYRDSDGVDEDTNKVSYFW